MRLTDLVGPLEFAYQTSLLALFIQHRRFAFEAFVRLLPGIPNPWITSSLGKFAVPNGKLAQFF